MGVQPRHYFVCEENGSQGFRLIRVQQIQEARHVAQGKAFEEVG
jgi:hypothetical protein